MRTTLWRLLAVVFVLGLLTTACTSGDPEEPTDEASDAADASEPADTAAEPTDEPDAGAASGSPTIAEIQERGTLNCGVNGQLAGFSIAEGGEYSGFDVDYCRAIAAALLDDPEAVEFTDLTADTRFTALQSGEIDVLIRNSTWTSSRDGDLGLQWTQPTFYDGQGMLVADDSEFQTLDDMQDTTICVQSGTTTELNLASVFAARGITYEPLLLPDEESITTSFAQEACDGYTTDRSGLASFATTFTDFPVRILDETMSKEPLGPSVREGDDKWFDAVNWIVFATIQAEEFGLTQDNIATAAEDFSDNPEIVRFVGQADQLEGEDALFTSGLELPDDYAVKVIEAVGNYGEIYDRNITPLGLERGVNSLWNDEESPGLLYPPPYR